LRNIFIVAGIFTEKSRLSRSILPIEYYAI